MCFCLHGSKWMHFFLRNYIMTQLVKRFSLYFFFFCFFFLLLFSSSFYSVNVARCCRRLCAAYRKLKLKLTTHYQEREQKNREGKTWCELDATNSVVVMWCNDSVLHFLHARRKTGEFVFIL